MGKKKKDKDVAVAEATGSAGTEEVSERRKTVLREIIEAVAIALVLALIIRTFVVQAFKIPSSSMENTLLIGDHILVSKFSYGLQVPRPAIIRVFGIPIPFFETNLKPYWGEVSSGDVVVFRYPGDRTKDYIKRVIGTPGDRVEVRNKVIYLNSEKWDDPYGVIKGGLSGNSDEADNFGPYTVPEDHVFVMGDNRDRSYDSRFWGPVPFHEIRGRAFIIYFSWDGIDTWVRFDRLGMGIK